MKTMMYSGSLTWSQLGAIVALFTVISLVTADHQHVTPCSHHHQVTPGSDSQQVTPGSVDVEAYLRKYGYLSAMEENSLDYKEQKSKALRMFQTFAQLDITGEEDEATLKQMQKPRCGLADITPDEYGLSGGKWNTTRITYKFINFPNGISPRNVRSTIGKAFQMWANVSPLTFRESSGTVIIEILFKGRYHGDSSPFDGPYGVLAHAYYPSRERIGGDTHFDGDEKWVINGGKGKDLLYVAVHEFGHALGLTHSSVRGAIMAPYYRRYTPNMKLSQDDIAGIQAKYGKRW